MITLITEGSLFLEVALATTVSYFTFPNLGLFMFRNELLLKQ